MVWGALEPAAVSRDGARWATTEAGGRRVSLGHTTRPGPPESLAPGVEGVTSLAFSAAGDRLAAGTATGVTVVWRGSDRQPWRTLRARPHPVRDLAFSPGGRLLTLVVDGQDGVEVWDLEAGRRRTVLYGPSRPRALACAPDGRTLAVGGPDGVILWDLWRDRRTARLEVGPGGVDALAFSPDGRRLAVGGGQLRVVDAAGGPAGWRAEVAVAGPGGLAFSADGALLASASGAGPVHVHQSETGQLDGVFLAGTPAVRALGFLRGRVRLCWVGDGMQGVFRVSPLGGVLAPGARRGGAP